MLEQPADANGVAGGLVVHQWLQGEGSPFTGQSSPFPFIRVERRVGRDARIEQHQIGLGGGMVGGIDAHGRGSGPDGQVPHGRFSTRWNGPRLVFEKGSYSGPSRDSGPYTEYQEEWSLDAEGRLVIVVTEQSSTTYPTRTEFTYRRR